jgi:hypothetical protein
VERLLKGPDLSDDQATQILNFLKIKDLKAIKRNFKKSIISRRNK